MADEIKRDTVDYRDPTPFDNTKINSLSDISKALRHKTYGEDTREAIAQQGEALAKLMQETGGNQSAEVIAARGPFEQLNIREDAQENAINLNNLSLANKADKSYIDNYLSQISYSPEAVASLADLKNKYPGGKPGLFVAADNGHKYIWTAGTWKDSGVYQSTTIADGAVKTNHLSSAAVMGVKFVTGLGIPSYNTTTKAWNWGGTENQQAIIYVGDNNYTLIEPQLTILNPAKTAASKLIWNGATFEFIGWEQRTPVGSYVVALVTNKGNTTVTADFPVEIDGRMNYDQYSAVTFLPSRNGLPIYDSSTKMLDFKSTENKLAVIKFNDRVVEIPAGTTVFNDTKSINAILVFNIESGEFLFVQRHIASAHYVVIGSLTEIDSRRCTFDGIPVFVNGSLGVFDSANINGATPNVVQMYPCAGNPPLYDSIKQTFDFNSKGATPATIITNKEFHLIPVGTVAQPTKAALTNPRKKVVYDLKKETARVMGYWEHIPAFNVIICIILSGSNQPTKVLADFDVIIDGIQDTPVVQNPKHANITSILHRGYNNKYPEQSELAYVRGVKELGTHNWEGDIMFTSDNIPVMLHDAFIENYARKADGSEITEQTDMRKLTLEQLNTDYDFGVAKGEQFAGTKLLKFDDFCRLAKQYDAYIHVEFKYPYSTEQIQILHDTVVKWHMQENIAWQAFKRDMLKPMIELEPRAQIELLIHGTDTPGESFYEDAKTYETSSNRVCISLDSRCTNKQITDAVKHGYYVIVWVAYNSNDIKRFANLGVSAIMTNGLNVAEALLE